MPQRNRATKAKEHAAKRAPRERAISLIYDADQQNRFLFRPKEVNSERKDAARSAERGLKDRAKFESLISSYILEARRLVCRFKKRPKASALAALERDLRHAFLRALGEVAGDDSREVRIRQIVGRTKWSTAKRDNPDLTLLQHIERVYPDRKRIGMRRRDLADPRVDPQCYQALANWLRPKKGKAQNILPKNFGLPTKSQITDDVSRTKEFRGAVSVISKLTETEAKVVRARNAIKARRRRQVATRRTRMIAAE